jgi:hypothetical protein
VRRRWYCDNVVGTTVRYIDFRRRDG